MNDLGCEILLVSIAGAITLGSASRLKAKHKMDRIQIAADRPGLAVELGACGCATAARMPG
jgi:hypothetical protein